MNNLRATCPACNGTGRQPRGDREWMRGTWTHDEATDTVACQNCGGQTMSGIGQGETAVDPATGLGCLHQYVGHNAGRCLTRYTCNRCGSRYDIDSGD